MAFKNVPISSRPQLANTTSASAPQKGRKGKAPWSLKKLTTAILHGFEPLKNTLRTILHSTLTVESEIKLETHTGSTLEEGNEQADEDSKIRAQQKVVDITSDGHPNKPMYLNNVAKSYILRFQRFSDLSDIEKAVLNLQQAVDLTPDGHADKPEYLTHLGQSYYNRFLYLGDLSDIDLSVLAQQHAVDLTPDGHVDKPIGLNNLGSSFIIRFRRLGDLSDMENAILNFQKAVDYTPDGHAFRPRYLTNLGYSFLSRFERLGDLPDLDNAIQSQQKAVDLTPDGDADKPIYFNNLGVSLAVQFKRLGDLRDIENAILDQQQAVDLTPDGHADQPMYLSTLGTSLAVRFERLSDLSDIEKAIIAHQHAVDLAPNGHANKSLYLSHLGASFAARFKRLGDIPDIDKAILASQQAVNLTPDGHVDKPTHLISLGASFRARFARLGHFSDIEKAILAQQHAIDLTPDPNANKPPLLNHLGSSYRARFEHLHDLQDIEKAILAQQQAIDLTPDGYDDKHTYISNLGTSFWFRFLHLGDLFDIDKSILAQQQAIDLTPEGHARMPQYLCILGAASRVRFERLGDFQVLEQAILAQQQAVDLTPDGHAKKPFCLSTLGVSLAVRFERLGELSDIDKAIVIQQHAINLTPNGHVNKPMYLMQFGYSFWTRFKRLGDLSDAEKAIIAQKQAVDLTPEGHAHKPAHLNHLANSFAARFELFREPKDYHCGRDNFVLAMKGSGAPSVILNAAQHLLRISLAQGDTRLALEASGKISQLIPRVVWLGQSVHRRLELVEGISESVSASAAAAITAGDTIRAFESLEEGRSILWRQILQLRTPFDELRKVHVNISNELESISRRLESAGTATDSRDMLGPNDGLDLTSGEIEVQEHRQLARRYEDLINDVRTKDGFENFFLPMKMDHLKAAAKRGPVVVINIHELRCDALILLQCGLLRHVQLEDFSCEAASDMYSVLRSCLDAKCHPGRGQKSSSGADRIARIVEHLESSVTGPILKQLQDEGELSSDNKGAAYHITWCSSGPLSFLPLHAAAIRSQKRLQCPPIVSSYTPSLTALVPDRNLQSEPRPSLNILAVSQSYAQGYASIPNTREEIKLMKQVVRLTWLDEDKASTAEVLDAMEKYNVVHLACHGKQDSSDPTRSAFVLSDGDLSLHDLMKKNLKNAQIAVLSACHTAAGDQKRPEEAMHLAAGMLSAGFRSVVGTMWSIEDADAPMVAEAFYSKLLEFEREGRDDWRLKAAHALHYAVEKLREKIGDEEYLRWLPFVHYGM